ncbi:hypothetical protein BVX93_02385 [bacterium B13(2017)]|nr:hypothetical protein BVX93_02385 [bacterium B13(2017)]
MQKLLYFILFVVFTSSLGSYTLDNSILELRKSLSNLDQKEFVKQREKLFGYHKKRIKSDDYNDLAKMSFIEDDIKFGNGFFAFHLLPKINTNDAILRLIELNLDPYWEGRLIRVNQFTINWFKAFWNKLFSKNIYEVKIQNAKDLLAKVDNDNLTFDQQVKYGNLKALITGEKKTEVIIEKEEYIPLEKVAEKQIEKIEEEKIIEKPKEKEIIPESEPEPEKEELPKIEEYTEEPNKYFWEVVKTIKEVRVKREGFEDWKEVKAGERLFEGDTFMTGEKSSVTLFIRGLDNRDSFTQLFENTKVKVIQLSQNNLDELDDVYLDIILGEVLVNVEDLPETSSFKVKTPSAVAAVRGTLFATKVLFNMVKFLLFKGVLQITDIEIAREVIKELKAGYSLSKSKGESFQEPNNIPDKVFIRYKKLAVKIAQNLAKKKGITIRKYKGTRLSYLYDPNIDPFKGTDAEDFEDDVPILIDPNIKLEQKRREEAARRRQQEDEEETSVTDFYVSTNGSDSSGSGAESNPFGTIAYALSQASGTESVTIYVVNTGTPYTLTQSLNLKSFVTIRGSGGQPTITSDISTDANFNVDDKTNVVLRDLNIINTDSDGSGRCIDLSSGSLTIIDSSVGDQHGINMTGNSGTLETDNVTFDSNGTGAITTEGGTIIDYGSTFNGMVSTAISNNAGNEAPNLTLNSTTFTNNSITPIDIESDAAGGGSNISLDNCTITGHGFGVPVINVTGDGGVNLYIDDSTISNNNGSASPNPSMIVKTGDSGIVRIRNTFLSDNSSASDGWDSILEATNQDVRCFNVLVEGNDTHANLLFNLTDPSAVQIINCTFVDGGGGGAETGVQINTPGNIDPSPCDFYNSVYDNLQTGMHVNGGVAPAPINMNNDIFIYNNDFNTGSQDIWDAAGSGTSYNVGGGFDPNTLTNSGSNIGAVPQYDASFVPTAAGNLEDAGAATGGFSGFPSTDIDGGLRDKNGIDIGAQENQGADPVISGRVYNSVTGEIVTTGAIGIYQGNSTQALDAVQSGNYAFNVFPGSYRLSVSGTNIYFPSQRLNSTALGDHGESFQVFDGVDQTINVPVDTLGYLGLEKNVNKKTATPGEIITYHLRITNNYWFETVSDIWICETRNSGLKLVPGSVILNGAKRNDPELRDGHLAFNIGSISARHHVDLTYQVVVSTGLSYGSYQSDAVCRNSSGEYLSATATTFIRIVPDPLFTSGTLIGRVFIDQNNNGIFDNNEEGVSKAIVATEYGALIGTDVDGMFHLKNIFPGRHNLQVDPESLPSGYMSGNKHGFSFEILEGSITKVNIPVVRESYSSSKEFFFVCFGEITLRDNNIDGNIEMIEKDSEFDEDLTVEGRGAFFLKGKVLGKYLITASFDSERLSRKQKVLQRNILFSNLDPKKYYPVYGDGSKVDYSALNTQDALYVLIEWDDSEIKWGSIEIDWPMYRRTMQGGQVILKNLNKTKLEGFYATTDYQTSHEEFIGTGNSLYHLENTPIIEGSEKVRIRLKNRFAEKLLFERVLVEQVDYTIDYEQGRIVLKRPLTSTILNMNDSIVSDDILAGAKAILVVDYEYENVFNLDRAAYGARIEQSFGEKVKVEAGYVEEDRDGDPYTLISTKTTVQINQDTKIEGAYYESEESYAGGGFSYDGGLEFLSQGDNAKVGEKGTSWEVSAETRIFDKVELNALYTEQDPGFSALSSFSESQNEYYEANLKYDINDYLSLALKHLYYEVIEVDEVSKANALVDELEKTSLSISFDRVLWDTKLEYVYQQIGKAYEGLRYLGSLPPRGEQLLAIRFGWKPFEKHYYYLIAQTTIEKEDFENYDNDMITLGIRVPLFDKIDIQMEGRSGDIGDSAILSFIINEDSDEQSHIGFETGTHREQGKFESLSFSKTYLTEKGIKYRFIKDYNTYNHRVLNGDIFDMEIPISNKWSVGIGFETSEIDEIEAPNAISRDVATLRYNFLEPGFIKFFGKIEWREDTENILESKTELFYIEDELSLMIFDGLTFRLKGAYGFAEEDENDEDTYKFKQMSAGFAFRPKKSDWLNILGRHTYTYDLPLDNRFDFIENSLQRKRVTAIDSIIDLTKYFQLVEKIAYREMEEKVGQREWVDSDTYLWINGINIKFLGKWTIGVEYRILNNKSFEDKKSGYLFQIKRAMTDWMDITLGYNFTKFDDNLTNRDEYDRSGGFLRLEGRY